MTGHRFLVTAAFAVSLLLLGIVIGVTWSTWNGSRRPMGGGMSNGMMGPGMMMGRGQMGGENMKQMMEQMMPGMLPPGILAERLPDAASPGAQLVMRYCAQCHGIPSPAMHSAAEWPGVTSRMYMRMEMMSGMMGTAAPTAKEQDDLTAYLVAHALRSLPPEGLPEPDSAGAMVFQSVCSQCHAVPDPALHTAQEWELVVERMRGNMRAMGKRVIADRERDAIVDYLIRHALP